MLNIFKYHFSGNKLAITCCLLSLASGGAEAANDSVDITITGRVLANTCTIDKSESKLNPILPPISDRDIKGVGVTGQEIPVTIALKDCGANVESVKVSATGTSGSSSNKSVFGNMNTDSNAATGVGLYFFKRDTGVDKFNTDGSNPESYTLTPSRNNTLSFRASYVGTADTVTAGEFRSVVTLSMTYQ